MPKSTAVLEHPLTLVPDDPDDLGQDSDRIVYIAAISVRDAFVDHEYQRDLDLPRSRRMAKTWDPRLVGVIDVSDRGPAAGPDRYAIINGQHRWEAAKLVDPDMHMVANVHLGLTPADEARLFYTIDAQTRRLTGWDRWNARRAAGDPVVLSVEKIAAKAGLRVDPSPREGNLRCVSTCEKVLKLGGPHGALLLGNTLRVIVETWDHRQDAVDAMIVLGIALILHTYGDHIEYERLIDVLIGLMPAEIRHGAHALRGIQSGQNAKLAALVMLAAYNKSPGRKLNLQQLDRP